MEVVLFWIAVVIIIKLNYDNSKIRRKSKK